jgi:tRNA(Ile)-lysidine synthetase-like protein
MDISVAPGRYVVAVSGGVDSMVLLDLLRQRPDLDLVVAHFDHGIRPDSAIDRQLVQQTAQKHGLRFVYDEGHLGTDASEAQARQARYQFLRRVAEASQAQAIITAHHQDDWLETAIHNMIRGTNRLGLTSLKSRPGLERPLLNFPKITLQAYARDQGLTWREDSTNQNLQFSRNYIRQRILPRFNPEQKQQLLGHLTKAQQLNQEIDQHLQNQLHLQPALNQLDRYHFIMLPHRVAMELFAAWLRRHDIRSFDQKQLTRLIIAGKTLSHGRYADIDGHHQLYIGKDNLALVSPDR